MIVFYIVVLLLRGWIGCCKLLLPSFAAHPRHLYHSRSCFLLACVCEMQDPQGRETVLLVFIVYDLAQKFST